jgi:hypothetical protein
MPLRVQPQLQPATPRLTKTYLLILHAINSTSSIHIPTNISPENCQDTARLKAAGGIRDAEIKIKDSDPELQSLHKIRKL